MATIAPGGPDEELAEEINLAQMLRQRSKGIRAVAMTTVGQPRHPDVQLRQRILSCDIGIADVSNIVSLSPEYKTTPHSIASVAEKCICVIGTKLLETRDRFIWEDGRAHHERRHVRRSHPEVNLFSILQARGTEGDKLTANEHGVRRLTRIRMSASRTLSELGALHC